MSTIETFQDTYYYGSIPLLAENKLHFFTAPYEKKEDALIPLGMIAYEPLCRFGFAALNVAMGLMLTAVALYELATMDLTKAKETKDFALFWLKAGLVNLAIGLALPIIHSTCFVSRAVVSVLPKEDSSVETPDGNSTSLSTGNA